MARSKKNPPMPAIAANDERSALAAALRVLDDVLTLAVDKQARLLGPATLLDPWRGMHLDESDVRRLLDGTRPDSLFEGDVPSVAALLAHAAREVPRVALTAGQLQLSPEDVAILLIVLAPELDRKYERIYGYLQDDVTRKRPTLELLANLLARNTAERLAIRERFTNRAPLSRSQLLRADTVDPSPLAWPWRIDDLWRMWLLRDGPMGDGLGEGLRLVTGRKPRFAALALPPAVQERVEAAISLRSRKVPMRLLVQGPHGAGKFALANAIAAEAGANLLALDLRDCTRPEEIRAHLQRSVRAATLFDAILYVYGIAALERRDVQLTRTLLEALGGAGCSYLLSCAAPLPAAHGPAVELLRIDLAYPEPSARRVLWRAALAARGLRIEPEEEARIAARFSLSAAQIEQAVAESHVLAAAMARTEIGYAELATAVRQQCGTELARMAQRVVPRADFSELVVPGEVLTQLREICARVATRDTVGREWSDGSVHARATGVTALFVGSSGTGKTLSAEALARELGLDLYRIDLAGIVSKYIGETEKNLDRVFAAAEHANAVLFFDEADALFGKRSEVKDAHDRYANIEVAYLLQKMEQFDGLAILASNLKQNLDEAFARRLTFTVTFPFPEEAERHRLWQRLWPARAPRAEDVDLQWFAREFRLSGGNIRNTVLAAAHLAAADGAPISHAHLLHATRREYQKLGKNMVHPAVQRRAG